MNRDLVYRFSKPMLVFGIVGMALLALPSVGFGQNGNAFFDFQGGTPATSRRPDRYILQAVAGGISPGLLIQRPKTGGASGRQQRSLRRSDRRSRQSERRVG